tara:strand:+ start:239 stop:637 length:399 start_codon:yes stop_codon:yes gene_type:complete
MVFTKEERRLRKNASQRKWYLKNAESEKARVHQWQKDNPEKARAHGRKYMKKFNSTVEGKKKSMISHWKQVGLIGNHEKIYDYYFKIDKCQECECDFSVKGDGIGRFKCMDHCHKTGLFRNVLCSKCNLARR